MTDDNIALQILKASHLENWKWSKEITEILGPDHPKAIKQWEKTNKILHKKEKLIEYGNTDNNK